VTRSDTDHPSLFIEVKADKSELTVVGSLMKKVCEQAKKGKRLAYAVLYHPGLAEDLVAIAAKQLPEFIKPNSRIHRMDFCLPRKARVFVLFNKTSQLAVNQQKTPVIGYHQRSFIGGLLVCRRLDLDLILEGYERRGETRRQLESTPQFQATRRKEKPHAPEKGR